MPDRVAIFIDGSYLDNILRKEYNMAKINYQELANWMSGHKKILRTNYYACHPYQSYTPTEDEYRKLERSIKFFHMLNSLPRFEVKEGKLEYRGQREDGSSTRIKTDNGYLICDFSSKRYRKDK